MDRIDFYILLEYYSKLALPPVGKCEVVGHAFVEERPRRGLPARQIEVGGRVKGTVSRRGSMRAGEE